MADACTPGAALPAPARKHRILLVEDDEISREMLRLRLEISGYDVLLCDDGTLVFPLVGNEQPDLILLDMNLPHIDGWTLASLLKAHPDTWPVPIIGVSAHAMVGDRHKALGAGCDEYETKPIEWGKLHPKITSLLQRGRHPA